MKRLFVAVDLPETVKSQLNTLCAGLVSAKWVSYPQMHLTLRFIGDVDEAQQHNIQTGLASVHAAPFPMTLNGVGQFPPRGKPRVVWVGIEADSQLDALYKQIEQVITHVGFPAGDHAFSPHITLARFKMPPPKEQMERYIAQHQTFRTDLIHVTQFVLYSSQLTPSGSIYHQEDVFPLA